MSEILWQPNPLHTRIVLTEADKEILRLKIQIDQLEEILGEADMRLTEGDRFDLEGARKTVAYTNWCADENPDNPTTAHVDKLLAHAVDELENGVHCGDCTCVPMSCSKCWAEGLLGIDTTKGAGKHGLYKIDGAFNKKNDGTVTIEAAINRLVNYVPHAEWQGWEAHARRWKAEANSAAKWLTAYRDTHFPTPADPA